MRRALPLTWRPVLRLQLDFLGRDYPYFFCSARITGTACSQRTNIRPDLIEDAIERYYVERPVRLTADDLKQRTEAIESLVAVSQQAVLQVKQVKTRLIAKLKVQQGRLIRLHALLDGRGLLHRMLGADRQLRHAQGPARGEGPARDRSRSHRRGP